MSSVICGKCGRSTNTAVSEYWGVSKDGKALRCFAAWENDRWVPGCGKDDKDEYAKLNNILVAHLFVDKPKDVMTAEEVLKAPIARYWAPDIHISTREDEDEKE